MVEQPAIVIGADHGGFELKGLVKEWLEGAGYSVVDVGCHASDSVDYPDYAEKAVAEIAGHRCQNGILICGTGIGMSIAANRHRIIRAANCHNTYTAQMSREHNNANILCLGARVIDGKTALEVVKVWLSTEFSGGRHQRRIEKFSD